MVFIFYKIFYKEDIQQPHILPAGITVSKPVNKSNSHIIIALVGGFLIYVLFSWIWDEVRLLIFIQNEDLFLTEQVIQLEPLIMVFKQVTLLVIWVFSFLIIRKLLNKQKPVQPESDQTGIQ